MGSFPGPGKIKLSAADDYLFAKSNKFLYYFFQIKHLRTTIANRQHDDAERRLHLGKFVKLIENDGGVFIPFQINHNANAFTVRFIPQVSHAADFLIADQFRYFFDQGGFVDLIWQFRNDDAFFVITGIFLDERPRPEPNNAASCFVSGQNAFPSIDKSSSWKIRSGDMTHQLFNGNLRIFNEGDGSVYDFRQIVGWNIGGHTYGDTGCTVKQQQGYFSRQKGGLLKGFIVIRHVIDCVFFQIGQHLIGNARQTDFCITHGRRRITINGTEVSLTIYQHVTQGKILRHTHQCIIDRHVSVRMILSHDITDNAGGFFIRFIVAVAHFIHGIQDPSMNRLEAVSYIGKGPADNDAHSVVHV